ncbi:MAG TPA: oligosaccharide flippase family protein [Ardenticatenaceae bacterium]|nr:oligosaccharide flippase family protein [Ardenticatenaceae bacterium]
MAETGKAPATPTNRRLVAGTLQVFMAEALSVPTGLLTVVVLTRHLGPADYGLYNLALAIVAALQWIIVAVLGHTTVKFVSQAEDWRPVGAAVVRFYLIVSLAVMLLLWLLAAPLAGLLGVPGLAPYLRLFALEIPVFSVARAHRNILIGLDGVGERALIAASRWISRLLLIVAFIALGLGIWGAILGSIGAALVELIVGRMYIRPPLFRVPAFPIRRLWGYAVPLFLSAVSLRLYNRLDVLALQALGGSVREAGIYSAAQNIALFPGLVSLSFAPLLTAALSRLLQGGETQAARQMGRNAFRIVIALIPFAGLIAGAAPGLALVAFGHEFRDAGPLMALLIFGALALLVNSVASAMLVAAGRPRLTLVITLPLLPLALAGNVLLIPVLAALGAAIATTLAATVTAIIAVAAVYRASNVLPPIGTLARGILIGICAYAALRLWPAPGMWLFVQASGVALLILLGFLALGELSASELAAARSMLPWTARTRRSPGQA